MEVPLQIGQLGCDVCHMSSLRAISPLVLISCCSAIKRRGKGPLKVDVLIGCITSSDLMGCYFDRQVV